MGPHAIALVDNGFDWQIPLHFVITFDYSRGKVWFERLAAFEA
jgi:hypothetical protein